MSRSGWAALHQTLRSCRSAGTEPRGDSRERAVSGGELPYDRWLWALSVRQLKQARCASAFLLARWQAKVLQDVRPRSTKKSRTTAQGGLRNPRRPRTRHVSTAIKLYSGPDYITPFQKKKQRGTSCQYVGAYEQGFATAGFRTRNGAHCTQERRTQRLQVSGRRAR